MNYLLYAFICVHGLIHLIGFFKAFSIGNFPHVTRNISRAEGWFWLLACILFLSSVLLRISLMGASIYTGMLGVVISQALIIKSWKDAKPGTFVNGIILFVLIIWLGSHQFYKKVNGEIRTLIADSKSNHSEKILTEAELPKVPPVIQKWLRRTGSVGKPVEQFIYLRQEGKMKMNPDGEWRNFTALQYDNLTNPALIWKARVHLMPFTYILGRDKFMNGEAEMLIRLFGLFRVVKEKNTPQINEATMLRYMGEMCWYPSAAMNEYISWQQTDSLTAVCTMNYKGTKAEGVFVFNSDGDPISYTADRYFSGTLQKGEQRKKEKWEVTFSEFRDFEGIRVPSSCDVVWKLKTGDFHWLTVTLMKLEINRYEF